MRVSVIVPTYNRDDCLPRALESVLHQTFQEIELIVVDDGSSDRTREVVSSYAGQRIPVYYLKHENNRGVAQARNTGMRQATGEYFAFQDSDDCWHPDKLEKQMAALTESGADFCYSYFRYEMDGAEKEYCIIPNVNIALARMNGCIFPELYRHNLVGAPTLVMKRTCFEQTGGFDDRLPALEDYDYAIRLAKKFQAVFVNECLVETALSSDSLSVNPVNHLIAGCMLAGRYKKELLAYDCFDSFVEKILRQSQQVGLQEKIIPFLEKMLSP